ncbi:MAG: transglycosylase domain-containing protein, partial [Chloroflexi bacterium]|nr:transglycosylase domain-containing protein [Chloroflexota bacterium]
MQTSLARRQARRLDHGRRGKGSGPRRVIAGLSLFIFATMATVAVGAFVGVVGVYAVFSQGLSDPRELYTIQFVEESIVYARDGETELARFSSGERREVVAFADLPTILIDATTAVEDKSFWTNTGFDPLGIVAAGLDTISGDLRGASTITQQLVRQRLLPSELVQDPDRRVERKIKEIIQSIRVTQAFPGRDGKERIITAYLHQNFYGNNSYGVAAAAEGYFGKELSELTLSEAALLAALPQSPSNYDLVRNAVEDDAGRLIVPQDTDIVERRNLVLQYLADDPTRRVLTGDEFSREDFLAAQDDEVVLVDQELPPWLAPHFIWAVRDQLTVELCADAATCPELERGGLRIVTTLDMAMQASAEKWVKAA